MENQTNSLSKAAMMYGLYLGIAMVLVSVIFYILGNPFSKIAGYLSYIIMIGLIAWAMYAFSHNENTESFTYGRALGLGTLQALFGSIIIALFTLILYKFIDPTLIEKLISYTEQELLKSGKVSEDQIDTVMSMAKKTMTPELIAISSIFSYTFFGFIFSLILAIFFKKKSSNPFQKINAEDN